MLMTHAEIDALACPAGTIAGQRCSDPDILTASPWRTDLSLSERQAEWRRRETATARRMVDALGKREGWSDTQREAALSVALDIPVCAVKGRRSFPVDALAVYREAARRAAI